MIRIKYSLILFGILFFVNSNAQDIISLSYQTQFNASDCVNCIDTLQPNQWSDYHAAYIGTGNDGFRIRFEGQCGMLLYIESIHDLTISPPYVCLDTITTNWSDKMEVNGCGSHSPYTSERFKLEGTNAEIEVRMCGTGANFVCFDSSAFGYGKESVKIGKWGKCLSFDSHHNVCIQFRILDGGNLLNFIVVNKTDASCFTINDGSVDLTMDGINAPYTFQWSTGDTTEDVSGLLGGIYWVTVTDAKGCSNTKNILIGPPELLVNSGSLPNVGGNTGTAWVNVFGGTPPYTYQWDDPSMQTTDTATNLSGGIYHVEITDSIGCILRDTIEVDGVSSIDDYEHKYNLKLFPNPNTGLFNLSFVPHPADNELIINFYRLDGKLLISKSIPAERIRPNLNMNFDLEGLAKGIYYIQIISNNNLLTRKVIYQ